MQVTKRSGEKESVKFEKISKRISRQSKDLKNIDVAEVSSKIISGLYNGVSSMELDNLGIEVSYALSVKHPEYDVLAKRLAITALHKTTESSFSAAMDKLQQNKDSAGKIQPILSDYVYKFIKKNSTILDATIDSNRDFLFDYFGFKTLCKSYLQKVDGQIVERPQYLWMRVACGIHFDDIEAAIQTYHLLSTMQATHATPTLYHSGTVKNQLASCFLLSMKGDRDSVVSMYDTLKDVAMLSKHAGGIGVHVHDIRSKGSPVYGTNGTSDGLIPMLKVYNETAKHINQSGRRKGSFAFYLSDWHNDIFEFLDLRKNNGKEELRARDIFIAVWVSDHFMRQVEADGDWYLMNPNASKNLSKVYDEREDGGSFTDLYTKYVSEGKFVRKIKARDLWQAILVSMMETGTPYLLSKDSINRKSNQKNIGVVESSNLCLAGDTKIWVKDIERGQVVSEPYEQTLKNVVDSFWFGCEYLVKSFDLKKNEACWNLITDAALTKENAEVLKITSKCYCYERNIICTPGHEIYCLEKDDKTADFAAATFIDRNCQLKLDLNIPIEDQCRCEPEVINEKLSELIDVYDITVENTHCFFANDILVHNCAEITEVSTPDSVAVCTLASVSLPSCVEGKKNKRTFNFQKLENITKNLVDNLEKTIDIGFYPIESAKTHMQHRPIGIGIQGLANVFALMRFTWEGEEAKKLNRDIAESMYYAGIKASCELAKKHGPYLTFKGSPLSEGKFQFDLWNVKPSNRYDWEALRKEVMEFGVRHSLLFAKMPTASSSQLLGNVESFEAFTSNIYKRQTLSGEFIQVNKYLVEDLMERNLWTEEIRQKIIALNGSVQGIKEIPDDLKELYKTVWEIKQKTIIDLVADAAPYVCQSASMNLYLANINIAKLSSALNYAWKKGLKTLVYYTRNTASREAIKFTVDKKIESAILDEQTQNMEDQLACSIDNKEACEACSG